MLYYKDSQEITQSKPTSTNLFGHLPETQTEKQMQHTTVTVQGYAWCPKSRTHSESVITEHANRVEAQAYIQRNKRILADLMIMMNNDQCLLDSLLASCQDIPEVRAAADRRLAQMERQDQGTGPLKAVTSWGELRP